MEKVFKIFNRVQCKMRLLLDNGEVYDEVPEFFTVNGQVLYAGSRVDLDDYLNHSDGADIVAWFKVTTTLSELLEFSHYSPESSSVTHDSDHNGAHGDDHNGAHVHRRVRSDPIICSHERVPLEKIVGSYDSFENEEDALTHPRDFPGNHLRRIEVNALIGFCIRIQDVLNHPGSLEEEDTFDSTLWPYQLVHMDADDQVNYLYGPNISFGNYCTEFVVKRHGNSDWTVSVSGEVA